MTRRLLLSFAIVVLTVGGCSSDGGGDGDSGRAAERDIEGLTPEGVALVRLLQRGASATYHATYQVRQEGAPDTTLEIWQRGERARADTVSGDAHVSTFRDGRATTVCAREAGVWTCQRDENAPSAVSAFVDRAVDDLRGRAITEAERSVAGQSVRCFAVADSGGVEICATAAGVPARLATDVSAMELTKLDRDVPASVFTPPVAPISSR